MTDVIIPTWAEVNSFVVLAAIVLGFVIYGFIKGAQEEKRTVKWIRDWNEPNIKEDW